MGYRERIAKLRAQEEEQDYIWLDREYETYSQNANRFINEVNSYGQRDENQWRNAAALGYAQKARDLQAQGQALQEKYRRAGKQEQAAALGSQLEQFGQMRAALEQDEKYWGQWGSQAAYDQYQADQQEYERIMGIDVQQTVARIETIDDMLMYPGARAVNEAALEEEKSSWKRIWQNEIILIFIKNIRIWISSSCNRPSKVSGNSSKEKLGAREVRCSGKMNGCTITGFGRGKTTTSTGSWW